MAYILKVTGQSTVVFDEGFDGSEVIFEAKDVEFAPESSDERQMGTEVLHIGYGYRAGQDSPSISWTVSEYPSGVINNVVTTIIDPVRSERRNFNFTIEDTDGGEDS